MYRVLGSDKMLDLQCLRPIVEWNAHTHMKTEIPSHYRPRSGRGWFFVIYFGVTFALTQWPFIAWANRIYPLILGFPFFYAYLTGVYAAILAGLLMLLGPARRS
jgi:hypothetical protein